MLVLGIESSCDETGAAVVDSDGRVLSDVVQSQVELHAAYGGVIPELASRDHMTNITPVIEEALRRANLSLNDIGAIAVTCRPGLVGALLVGVQVAKGISWGRGIPLIGVDHLVGHLLAVFLNRENDDNRTRPAFPFVALIASGGHSAIYKVDGPTPDRITELGATRDDAAGEAFDKVGKLLGLGYPGGPIIDRLAKKGDASRTPLTIPMIHSKTFEFSFSGLKTQIATHVRDHGVPSTENELADLCAAFQDAATRVLSEKVVRAANECGVKDVVIGGGVAANRELRERVTRLAEQSGIRAHVPDLASCTDNAAMIALAGAFALNEGRRDSFDLLATRQTALPRSTRKGNGPR